MTNAEYFTELKVEASQILWEIFTDQASLCAAGKAGKLLRSSGTMNMRATYREDKILTALLQGWKFIQDAGLEYHFLPYDYYYCAFFLNTCLEEFTALKSDWLEIIQQACTVYTK